MGNVYGMYCCIPGRCRRSALDALWNKRDRTGDGGNNARVQAVIWGMHGICGAGRTVDEAFGLIETVEKAAQIYMHRPSAEDKHDSRHRNAAAG